MELGENGQGDRLRGIGADVEADGALQPAAKARARLPELLAKGVRCYKFETVMMHAKLAVFDDAWAIVGTSNIDRQSLQHSYEVNLLAEGGELPHQLTRLVDEDLAVACSITRRSPSAGIPPSGLKTLMPES